MYAVVRTDGKQYKVTAGDRIRVEPIAAAIGSEIKLDQVLAVANGSALEFGEPLVSGASVSATVLAHGRAPKVRIFKMRRRKHYQKHQGHRQGYTELFIGGIASGAGEETADASAALERAREREARRVAATGESDLPARGRRRLDGGAVATAVATSPVAPADSATPGTTLEG